MLLHGCDKICNAQNCFETFGNKGYIPIWQMTTWQGKILTQTCEKPCFFPSLVISQSVKLITEHSGLEKQNLSLE